MFPPRPRRLSLCTVTTGLGLALLGSACGEVTVGPEQKSPPPFYAPVTFVVDSIVPQVWRVDIVVNNRDVDPLYGSFETALTDRVTMQVPAGDSLNAFARAFDGDSIILYIGEAYFDVKSRQALEVHVPLNYKGPHAPT